MVRTCEQLTRLPAPDQNPLPRLSSACARTPCPAPLPWSWQEILVYSRNAFELIWLGNKHSLPRSTRPRMTFPFRLTFAASPWTWHVRMLLFRATSLETQPSRQRIESAVGIVSALLTSPPNSLSNKIKKTGPPPPSPNRSVFRAVMRQRMRGKTGRRNDDFTVSYEGLNLNNPPPGGKATQRYHSRRRRRLESGAS